MKTQRRPEEIREQFESRKCIVQAHELGTSYRAGGEIFIFAPGINPDDMSSGVTFTPVEDFEGFSPTGYDGRGRHYAVWLVTPGDHVPATAAEYANASDGKRLSFGAESRSCSSIRFFVHKDEKASKGLSDFAGAFAKLGL